MTWYKTEISNFIKARNRVITKLKNQPTMKKENIGLVAWAVNIIESMVRAKNNTLYLGGAENNTVRDNICTIVREAAEKIEAEIEKLD